MNLGLPPSDTPLALLFFNVGVELGQLVFIAVILLVKALARRTVPIPRRASVAMSYAIGSFAAYWVFERLYVTFS